MKHITLRIYYLHFAGGVSAIEHRPEWFSYENCLKNFLKSLNEAPKNLDLEFNFVFNGSEKTFLEDFSSMYLKEYGDSHSIKINNFFVEGLSAASAGRNMYNLIVNRENVDDSDWIYILENDYIHIPGWLDKFTDIVDSDIRFHYLSLYDHPDRYQGHPSYWDKYSKLKSGIFSTPSCHWRENPSTCYTSIARLGILKKDFYITLWFRDIYRFMFLRILKRRILLSPIPSLSAHCMKRFLPTSCNWERINSSSSEIIQYGE